MMGKKPPHLRRPRQGEYPVPHTLWPSLTYAPKRRFRHGGGWGAQPKPNVDKKIVLSTGLLGAFRFDAKDLPVFFVQDPIISAQFPIIPKTQYHSQRQQ